MASKREIVTDPPSAANESTVAPAVAVVDAKESNSTADLFEGETEQLTDAVIANLTNFELSDISLFSFQNESTLNETLAKRAIPGFCKTYPSDPYWPFSSTWQLFNILLGGGLIKTVPYASSCYDSFKDYNSTKCDFITNNWINASIYQ